VKNLRKDNVIPGVLYGKHVGDPVVLSFDKQEFIKIYKKSGYSTPITLKGDGVDQLTLIQDIQLDPVTDYVLHVDFLGLKKGEKVKTAVTIILTGESIIEKLGEWKVQLVKNEVEVEALPKDLPHNITIDISYIESANDVIFVKDLVVGNGVEIVDDMEQAVVTVMALAEEVIEEEEVLVEEWEEGVETGEGKSKIDKSDKESEKSNKESGSK